MSTERSREEQAFMECGAAIGKRQMESFLSSFQQSTRRWEIVVYPALFAFTLLATYGFFLIYSLTSDMTRISNSIDPKMGEHMVVMSESMVDLSFQIQIMSAQMGEVSEQMSTMKPMLARMTEISEQMQALKPMLHEMQGINSQIVVLKPLLQEVKGLGDSINSMRHSINSINTFMENMSNNMSYMAFNTGNMHQDMKMLNQSISRPLSYFPMFPF